MNFDLDDQQRDLASAAGDFLASSTSLVDVRAALDESAADVTVRPGRDQLISSGFATITVPEEFGGGGGTVLDLAVVAEQAGRVLAGPSLITYARAAVLLDGDADRLRALADGSLSVAVIDGDGGDPVLDAAGADKFLALRDGRIVIGSGTVELPDPIDPTRGLGRVILGDDAEVVVEDGQDLWDRALAVGRTILAAESLGSATRAVEIGVAYAKERQAFGRPIGSYQAVKHALVDAYVGVEELRSLVWWSAWAADNAPHELPLASASAKGIAAVMSQVAAETLIQVHGGIGFTWEHDAHLYWRRAKVDRFLLGDDVAAFDKVARLATAGADVSSADADVTSVA